LMHEEYREKTGLIINVIDFINFVSNEDSLLLSFFPN